MNKKIIYGLGATALVLTSAAAYANWGPDHTANGGTIDGSLYKTAAQASSRAEKRRVSQTSGSQTMGGTMKMNGGNSVSVIQALNQNSFNASDGSEPAAQLALWRGSAKDTWFFYIVQGSSPSKNSFKTCAGFPTVRKGSTYQVSVTYQKGSKPVFTVDGTSCTATSGRDIGSNPYYGKLGAYNTSGGTTASSVTWTNVYH
jgi:hypothetical protein